jgi:outer membrane lipoprotein-sorting protein
MRMKKKITVLLLLLAGIVLYLPGNDDPRAREIVAKIDELYRSTSSYGLFEMEIVTPNWERKLKIVSWSLGKNRTFMRILEPKKEKGMATLKIDREMWNFLPKTNKVMKIPPSMMMGSWMGSDFTNDDLVKEYTYLEDYTFEIIEPEGESPANIYVKCTPKEGLPIIWGHVIIAAAKDGTIPVFQKYYDEKGGLMREMYFRDVKKFGNREIPSVMELIPTRKQGKKTVIRYLEASFDIKIDQEIFTLRNLRKGN